HEHRDQHAAANQFGEEVELTGDDLLKIVGDLAEAGREVAGALADLKLVEHEVGEAVGAAERLRERLALKHAVGGKVEGLAVDTVADLLLGHAEGVGGGDAVLQQNGEVLREG